MRIAKRRREEISLALNKRKVENILVPLAPLGTQRKIVSILESVDLQIVRTADTVQGATKHAQNLKEENL